jgi:hypothetical protein
MNEYSNAEEQITKQVNQYVEKIGVKKPKEKGILDKILDGVQVGLDVAGFIPVVGEIADGVNGSIYLARGDKVNAALSFAAMIPVVGSAATGAKYVNKGLKYGEEIADAGKTIKKPTNAKDQLKQDSADALITPIVTKKSSKGTDNVKHLDDVPRIKEIEVNFNRNVKHDPEEFARQLKDQEKGMNELTVDEYQKNRERYIAEGRAIEGNVAQQTAREEAFSDKVAELIHNGKSFDEAEKEAKEWLNTQAALHNPDQIAGGKSDKIDGMGHKGINSSIGAQWRYRIDVVDEQIMEIAKKMTPEKLKSTYLNVKLTR